MKSGILNKKGDGAMASSVIIIFAVLLMVYILLLPEDSRNDLLDLDDGNGNGNYNSSTTSKRLLLDESPGTIDNQGRTQYDYTIPSLRIITKTDAKVIKEENPFITKNGWFTKKEKIIEFEVEDKKNTDNLIVSFNTVKREGLLTAKLNDNLIYEKQITQYNADPIKISKEELNSGVNKLELLPSSVGIKFWSVNEYSIEGMKIMADVTDVSRQEAESVFYITDSRDNIDSATLKFVPECTTADVGKLTVMVNNNQVSSAVPDCKTMNSIILDPRFLVAGVNTVQANAEKGNFLLDQIKIRTELKQKRQPKYYFYIDNDKWDDIKSSDYVANFTMKFLVPQDDYIDMKVTINNMDFGIHQRNETFEKTVDTYLQKGNNVIQLSTKEGTSDVISMKLEIKKVKK